MGTYNLRNLQWLEFEELCCDVLGEELKVAIKRGKPGRDCGIDGIASSDDGSVVVQVKHYVESGAKALIQHLKISEVAKAEAIAAKRYVLMTSCDLSPNDRAAILEAYHGLIESGDDIYSGSDICALLASDKFRWIVRRHYNLWLSGMDQLELFCGDGINSKSTAYLDVIREDLRVAVKTQDYEHACARLINDNVIIITGQAGTGKTILAKQLIADFVFCLNYKFVCSEYDIKGFEVQIERHPNDAILFFIDDFLGANVMDALRENRDSQIVNFIRRVRRSENLKLILTSRSYIINEALDRTAKFSDAKIASFEYILDEKKLGRIDRAKILLSHFHHGDVSIAYKQSITADENYFKIIDHRNFNPRIIAYCFSFERVSTLNSLGIDGVGKVLWLLDNPGQIWRDCFESLNRLEKYVVIMVYLAGVAKIQIEEENLVSAFRRILASPEFAEYRTCVFSDVAKRLCRSVLARKYSADTTGAHATYSLFNPSVGDYILGAYNANENMFIECLLFLEQGAVLAQIVLDSSWQERSNPKYAHLCKAIVDGVVNAVVADSTKYGFNFVLKVYNEVVENYGREDLSCSKLADIIVMHDMLRAGNISGGEIVKFLDTVRSSHLSLYEAIDVDERLLEKTIGTTTDCEAYLLLGDLYDSIGSAPPDVRAREFPVQYREVLP